MRTSRIAKAVAGASMAAALGLTAPAFAQTIVEPAPGASAGASALQVRPADTSVGTAEAGADGSGSQASATAVRVAGNDLGTSTTASDGTTGTSLHEQSVGQDGYVRILPRFADARGNESWSYAALADAEIPGFTRLQVLAGYAQAAWTPEQSTSGSSATGAHVDLADGTLVVVLLRAEANGDGTGRLYVLRLNETTVMDTESSQPVSIGIPGVADIQLIGVNATAGRFTGRVVEALPLDDEDLATTASSVTAASGRGTVRIVEPPVPTPGPDGAVLGAAQGSPFLPRTGTDILRIALLGLGLVTLGAAAARSARQTV